MAGSLAITSLMVWPRASANRARQPQTSTTADMTRDPARPTAAAISGQASSSAFDADLGAAPAAGPPGDGTCRGSRCTARAGIGGVAGPSAVAAVSHPPGTALDG